MKKILAIFFGIFLLGMAANNRHIFVLENPVRSLGDLVVYNNTPHHVYKDIQTILDDAGIDLGGTPCVDSISVISSYCGKNGDALTLEAFGGALNTYEWQNPAGAVLGTTGNIVQTSSAFPNFFGLWTVKITDVCGVPHWRKIRVDSTCAPALQPLQVTREDYGVECYEGRITIAGTVLYQKNSTVTRIGTGQYQVAFLFPADNASYSPNIENLNLNFDDITHHIVSQNVNGFTVQFREQDNGTSPGSLRDVDFSYGVHCDQSLVSQVNNTPCPDTTNILAEFSNIDDVENLSIDFNVNFVSDTPDPGILKKWIFPNGITFENGIQTDLIVELLEADFPNDFDIVAGTAPNHILMPGPAGLLSTAKIRFSYDQTALLIPSNWRLFFTDIDGEDQKESVCFDERQVSCYAYDSSAAGRLTLSQNGTQICFAGDDNGAQSNDQHAVALLYFNTTSAVYDLQVNNISNTNNNRQFYPQNWQENSPLAANLDCTGSRCSGLRRIKDCNEAISYIDAVGNPVNSSLFTECQN